MINKNGFEENTQKAINELKELNKNQHTTSITQFGETNIVAHEVDVYSSDSSIQVKMECLEAQIEQLSKIISAKDEEIKTLKEFINTLKHPNA